MALRCPGVSAAVDLPPISGAKIGVSALQDRSFASWGQQHSANNFMFAAAGECLPGGAVEPRVHRRHLATCFGVGEATASLRSASDFLFNIDSGKAWDQFQELFKTPAVLAKYDKDFEYWVAEATDANNDLVRAKDLLQQALQDQAPQLEDEQTVIDQD